MQKLFYKKIILCVILLLALFFSIEKVYANNSIEEQRQQAQAQINRLKWLEKVETNKLYKNQQQLEKAQRDLNYSRKKYINTKTKLSSLQRNLNTAVSKFSLNEINARRRIRQIYKKQRVGFVHLLLTSGDLNTLLDRLYFENILARRDKFLINEMRAKARNLASIKHNVEREKQNLAYSINYINRKQKTIKRAINKNETLIQKLKNDRASYEKAEKELARQSATIGKMINRSSKPDNVSIVTSFMKPIPGRISSPFGWRTHPIFKSKSFHSGVDIAGANRGAIKASNAGKCIYSGWYGGYGKVVILDHGKYAGRPTTTLYAHMYSTKVKVGDVVTKGQTVGYEGTTGYSTGPHLHFEVRVEGKPNNPLTYIK